jgi:hypothetical protein
MGSVAFNKQVGDLFDVIFDGVKDWADQDASMAFENIEESNAQVSLRGEQRVSGQGEEEENNEINIDNAVEVNELIEFLQHSISENGYGESMKSRRGQCMEVEENREGESDDFAHAAYHAALCLIERNNTLS